MVEAASYLTIACSIYTEEKGWTRKQAIVGGLGVRLHKLSHGFLDQTCQNRREISEIISRLMFEASVHIVFFIQNESDYLEESFIDHSLKYERRLKSQIEGNVDARSGIVLPIEDRMLKSINRLAQESGIDLSQPPIDKRDWGNKNLFEKAKAIGWSTAYVGVFAGMSNAVHGSWGDIATHHLEAFDDSGYYRPSFDWSAPRPQAPLSLARMVCAVTDAMLEYFGGEELLGRFVEKLDDLVTRLDRATMLHEQFLAKRR